MWAHTYVHTRVPQVRSFAPYLVVEKVKTGARGRAYTIILLLSLRVYLMPYSVSRKSLNDPDIFMTIRFS